MQALEIEQRPLIDGFASRLDHLLDLLELDTFGRTTYISEISKLSWSGAKALFKDNRPPKRQQSRDMMFASLHHSLQLSVDPLLGLEDVEQFLLYNLGPLSPNPSKSFSNSDDLTVMYNEIEATFQGQAMLLLADIANKLNTDIFTELEEEQYTRLLHKFTIQSYQARDQGPIDQNKQLKELGQSLILVAKNALL